MLVLLSVITYLDRVTISVAAPAMQGELGMTPSQLGHVFGIFTLAYGAFEIPSVVGQVLGARHYDAVITLGAGSVGSVPRRLIEALEQKGRPH